MDPYIVTEMVRQHQGELLAEASRERLAAPLRGVGVASGLLAALATRLGRLRLPRRAARSARSGLGPVQ